MIAAGLDGVERELQPNKMQCIDIDPMQLTEEELGARGIDRLPSSLIEATEELERDTVLSEAMGTLLADSYFALRRADWEIFSSQDDAFELRNHFYKY